MKALAAALQDSQPASCLRRYTAVLHLVTAADGAPWAYRTGPEFNRPESPEEAIKLDRWLGEAWSGHPRYYRIDNEGKDWQAKSGQARQILVEVIHGAVSNT